jgi:homoserine kinase
MTKVHVKVPATCIGIGPGIGCLGLALAIHTELDIQQRDDAQFVAADAVAGEPSRDDAHPVIEAARALYAYVNQPPIGFSFRSTSRIPADAGLGDSVALTLAGLIAANNLLKTPISRDRIATLASELTKQPAAVVTALFGGLTVTANDDTLHYRRLPADPQKLVLVLPSVADYRAKVKALPNPSPSLNDLSLSMGRLAILIDAFAKRDTPLISSLLQDRILAPTRTALIPGYDAAANAARQAGAFGVILCGKGPAILAFTVDKQKLVAQAIEAAFAAVQVACQSWEITSDTQGVALSVYG